MLSITAGARGATGPWKLTSGFTPRVLTWALPLFVVCYDVCIGAVLQKLTHLTAWTTWGHNSLLAVQLRCCFCACALTGKSQAQVDIFSERQVLARHNRLRAAADRSLFCLLPPFGREIGEDFLQVQFSLFVLLQNRSWYFVLSNFVNDTGDDIGCKREYVVW